MKLSKHTTIAAFIALCFAGSAAAQSHDPSAGTRVGDNACAGNCGDDNVVVDSNISIRSRPLNLHDGSLAHAVLVEPAMKANAVVVAAYQKQLARHAAATAALIEDNAEILSTSCLVEVETLQRTLRNAYSSTGGQLPLNEPPFDRKSPEFRGYVAASVDQSRKTSMQIESMVTYNCQDPDATAATAFLKGAMVGPLDAAWFQSWDTFLEGGK